MIIAHIRQNNGEGAVLCISDPRKEFDKILTIGVVSRHVVRLYVDGDDLDLIYRSDMCTLTTKIPGTSRHRGVFVGEWVEIIAANLPLVFENRDNTDMVRDYLTSNIHDSRIQTLLEEIDL